MTDTLSAPQSQRPPKAALKIMNPIMKTILHTPFHGAVSNRLMLLTFTGRKSGQQYTTPVGYVQTGNTVLVATDSQWWKNLRGGASVQLRVRSQKLQGTADVITDVAELGDKFRTMIQAGPDLGRIMGVRLDANGVPLPDDVKSARERGFVVVQIQLK